MMYFRAYWNRAICRRVPPSRSHPTRAIIPRGAVHPKAFASAGPAAPDGAARRNRTIRLPHHTVKRLFPVPRQRWPPVDGLGLSAMRPPAPGMPATADRQPCRRGLKRPQTSWRPERRRPPPGGRRSERIQRGARLVCERRAIDKHSDV